MEILLYASAVIAALSLVLIAIYIVKTLKTVSSKAGQISESISRVEKKVNGLTSKSETLVNKANNIAEDAQNKLQAFNGVAESASQLKSSMQHVDESINKVSEKFIYQGTPSKKMRETLKWGDTVISLIKKYKGYKNSQTAK